MSYVVAVWDGDPPADETSARVTVARLEAAAAAGVAGPLSPALVALVAELTGRHPDLGDPAYDDEDDAPWADGPLADNVAGRLLTVALTWSAVDEVLPWMAAEAGRLGLHVLDTQTGRLL